MEDSASLGGRSSSTDAVSNDSAVIPPESEFSPRDGGDIADVGRHEKGDGSQHALSEFGEQEKTEHSFSELSVGTTSQDDTGTTPQNQTEATQDDIEATLQDKSGAIPRDEAEETQDYIEATPQDKSGAIPRSETEATQDDIEATLQYETGTTPQDEIAESDDNIGIQLLSPDPNREDRPTSKQFIPDADRSKQSDQEELADDVVSGTQSPIGRLSTSTQSRCEDATPENEIKELDVKSADGESLKTTDCQRHTSTGSPTGCCCGQPRELVKDELEAESHNVEVAATPIVLQTVESHASLEPPNESRLSCQNEPNLAAGDSLCDMQIKYEELERKESQVLGQCCNKKAVDDVVGVQSPEAANQLKAEITSLQSRLETLTKDNNEKGMRIVALETNLLEITSKLLNAEKKPLPLEVSHSRRETNKSRTCAVL